MRLKASRQHQGLSDKRGLCGPTLSMRIVPSEHLRRGTGRLQHLALTPIPHCQRLAPGGAFTLLLLSGLFLRAVRQYPVVTQKAITQRREARLLEVGGQQQAGSVHFSCKLRCASGPGARHKHISDDSMTILNTWELSQLVNQEL